MKHVSKQLNTFFEAIAPDAEEALEYFASLSDSELEAELALDRQELDQFLQHVRAKLGEESEQPSSRLRLLSKMTQIVEAASVDTMKLNSRENDPDAIDPALWTVVRTLVERFTSQLSIQSVPVTQLRDMSDVMHIDVGDWFLRYGGTASADRWSGVHLTFARHLTSSGKTMVSLSLHNESWPTGRRLIVYLQTADGRPLGELDVRNRDFRKRIDIPPQELLGALLQMKDEDAEGQA